MIIECTKKLADAMKITLEPYESVNSDSFYEWHANLFIFDRKKGVLLMNNKTRYCIVLYGLKMEHFKKIDTIILEAISETFLAEGFPIALVEKYISQCGNIKYAKTHDRSVLGQMKEFYISISWQIEDYLPSENINFVELNRLIGNSYMCGSLGYAHPIDLLKEEFKKWQ